MDERRKKAFREVLYSAMIGLRANTPDTWLSFFLIPSYWRKITLANRYADAMHNLAMYSAREFDGFNEEMFWSRVAYNLKDFPGGDKALRRAYEAALKEE